MALPGWAVTVIAVVPVVVALVLAAVALVKALREAPSDEE